MKKILLIICLFITALTNAQIKTYPHSYYRINKSINNIYSPQIQENTHIKIMWNKNTNPENLLKIYLPNKEIITIIDPPKFISNEWMGELQGGYLPYYEGKGKTSKNKLVTIEMYPNILNTIHIDIVYNDNYSILLILDKH